MRKSFHNHVTSSCILLIYRHQFCRRRYNSIVSPSSSLTVTVSSTDTTFGVVPSSSTDTFMLLFPLPVVGTCSFCTFGAFGGSDLTYTPKPIRKIKIARPTIGSILRHCCMVQLDKSAHVRIGEVDIGRMIVMCHAVSHPWKTIDIRTSFASRSACNRARLSSFVSLRCCPSFFSCCCFPRAMVHMMVGE